MNGRMAKKARKEARKIAEGVMGEEMLRLQQENVALKAENKKLKKPKKEKK